MIYRESGKEKREAELSELLHGLRAVSGAILEELDKKENGPEKLNFIMEAEKLYNQTHFIISSELEEYCSTYARKMISEGFAEIDKMKVDKAKKCLKVARYCINSANLDENEFGAFPELKKNIDDIEWYYLFPPVSKTYL